MPYPELDDFSPTGTLNKMGLSNSMSAEVCKSLGPEAHCLGFFTKFYWNNRGYQAFEKKLRQDECSAKLKEALFSDNDVF